MREWRRAAPTLPWLELLMASMLVAGIFLRFHELDSKFFWWDETFTLFWSAGYTREEVRAQLLGPPLIKTVDDVLRLQRRNPARTFRDSLRPLISEEPSHPPLFYALAHFWQRYVGDSMRAMRALPAWLALLVFPAAWLLCRELAEPPETKWILCALLAVSPFHIAYAQELRQYSLWTATILSIAATFARALRDGSSQSWCLFIVAAIVGLYTHLLTAFVLFALGLYFVWTEHRRARQWSGFLVSLLVICLAFLPWLALLYERQTEMARVTTWARASESLPWLLRWWSQNLGRVFFDLSNAGAPWNGERIASLLTAGAVLLSAYALLALARRGAGRAAGLVWALVLAPALLLVASGVTGWGLGSAGGRYWIPCYLGAQFAVAARLARELRAGAGRLRARAWALVLVGLLGLGLVGSFANVTSSRIWTKPRSDAIPAVAASINEAREPLVACAGLEVLGLAWLLDRDTRLVITGGDGSRLEAAMKRHPGPIYVYQPPDEWLAELRRRYRLDPLIGSMRRKGGTRTILYRMEARGPGSAG